MQWADTTESEGRGDWIVPNHDHIPTLVAASVGFHGTVGDDRREPQASVGRGPETIHGKNHSAEIQRSNPRSSIDPKGCSRCAFSRRHRDQVANHTGIVASFWPGRGLLEDPRTPMTRPSITSGGDLQGFIGTRPKLLRRLEAPLLEQRHEGRAVGEHPVGDLPGAFRCISPPASHRSFENGSRTCVPICGTSD